MANIALASAGSSASASTTLAGGFNAAATIDGTLGWTGGAASLWVNSVSGATDWLEVDFGQSRTFDQVVLYFPRNNGDPGTPSGNASDQAPRDFKIQYWNGASWVDVTGGSVTSNTLDKRTLNVTATTATKARFRSTLGCTGDGFTKLSEIEIFEAAADVTAPVVTVFTATANSASQITVAYTATDAVGVTGVDLDWSATGSGGWTSLLNNSAAASPYVHSGLAASTQYFYRLRARDAAGNVSGYSTANATTDAPTPGAVTLKLFPDSLMSRLSQTPRYQTSIVQGASGREQRTAGWSEALREYDAAQAISSITDAKTLLHFFHTCRGAWRSFYIWDYQEHDYELTETALTGNGVRTAFQMRMAYEDEYGDVVFRNIKRPKEETVEVRVDGVLKTETTHYTVDYDTGIITFLSAPANNAVITQKAEFYVKVRFLEDRLPRSLFMYKDDQVNLIEVDPIPLVELR